MAKEKKKANKNAIQISFKGVDSEIRKHGDRAARVPEGDYLVKVVDFEVRSTKDESGKYISWKVQIQSPTKYKGKTVYGMTSLKTDSLWNLRNLINAATGRNVAGKAVNFDPNSIIGKIVGAAIEDDEYNDKVRSRANTFFPKDEYEESDVEEDDDEDEDDEDEDDEDDEEEDDEEDDDLEEVEVEEI